MCVKLVKELPGLPFRPFKGEIGQKIYDSVSQDAWKLWIEHSKMLVNEYRIDLTAPEGQAMLLEQAEKIFFGEGAALPPDYKPAATK